MTLACLTDADVVHTGIRAGLYSWELHVMSETGGLEGFWSRVKKSRLVQVLIAYLAVSWGIL